MKIIEKDILTVENGVICHQVNCQGVMGSGLAKSIREKWPIVYEEYKNLVESSSNWRLDLLGTYQEIYVTKSLSVVNIFGQYNFGYDRQRYTDYAALNRIFNQLSLDLYNRDIYFPYNIGCDRGGGNWDFVSSIIGHWFPRAIICKLTISQMLN